MDCCKNQTHGLSPRLGAVEIIEIRRYPVKSLLGETVPAAQVGERGLDGDRLWAVRDPDGKFGSGKNTRRFRRMPGLFGLRAHTADPDPVSLITTAALRRLGELTADDGVDALRFRANVLVDVPGTGFVEDDWPGRRLRIGADVVLRAVKPLIRCVMIDMAQDGVGDRNDLLKTLARHHDLTFGVVATVERPGRIAVGDACSLL
jgi:uncharacterized protein YcbX